MQLDESKEFQDMVHELLDVLEKYDVSSVSAVIEGDADHGHLALVLGMNVYPTLDEAHAAVLGSDDEVPLNATVQ